MPLKEFFHQNFSPYFKLFLIDFHNGYLNPNFALFIEPLSRAGTDGDSGSQARLQLFAHMLAPMT